MEQSLRLMDQTELSLGPTSLILNEKIRSTSSELDGNVKRKRKQIWDETARQTSIGLQLSDPLSLDWEQCLDLQSGRMYYLNRKTLKKNWIRPPKEQELDLDLNISTFTSLDEKCHSSSRLANLDQQPKNKQQNSCSGNSMVAVVCVNCHLLVMLCKLSPSCPNCKYVHSTLPSSPPRKVEAKSSETLNLLY
ncbi:hypothetical protein Cni_G20423 [Canna indica]|uniref:WW domain-containing protein n=1 Tax=Canna indica TaxID=4628 RepID=A0AAQ3KNY2_9LILI|nr:hypothetical protein Cni_G20423 [Canna indica]